MNASWVDVLADPASIAQGRMQASTETMLAIAFLFEGRADEYERRAPALGLPPIGQSGAQYGQLDEGLLVQGFLRIMNDDPSAVDDLVRLGSSSSVTPDLRAVASALAGVALRDLHRLDASIALLQQCLMTAQHPDERALLLVHLGFAQAETGNFADAIEACEQAVVASQAEGTTVSTLCAIAQENAFQFRWAIGETGEMVHATAKWALPPIAWVNANVAEAGDELVVKSFDSFFENHLQRTWHFGTQDKVDRSLAQALFRLECLGAWSRVRTARKQYARYRLMREQRQTATDSIQALVLLSRSGDADGIKRAAASFRSTGPLEQVRAAGEQVVAAPWSAVDLKARLALLGETASVLSPAIATVAADRLMRDLDRFLQRIPGSGWVVGDVLEVLANLANVAGPAVAQQVSMAFRKLAEEPADPMMHQSLARSLGALSWAAVSARERREWLSYVQRNLDSKDDHVFVALSAAGELQQSGSRSVRRLALMSYRESKSLLLASTVVGLLRGSEAVELRAAVLASASELREQAHLGSFRMHTVSTGALLGLVAVSPGGSALIEPLVDYVMDPLVPVEERIAAVHYIIRKPRMLKSRLRARLGGGLPSPEVSFPFFGSADQLEATNLQVLALFGDRSPDDLIGSLLVLAHSSTAEVRAAAAAASHVVAQRASPRDVGLIVAGLTWDPSPYVRASAGRVLCTLAQSEDERAPEEHWLARIDQMLDEGGDIVPRVVWLGLHDRSTAGMPVPESFVRRARITAERHLSWYVRDAASRFLSTVPPVTPDSRRASPQGRTDRNSSIAGVGP